MFWRRKAVLYLIIGPLIFPRGGGGGVVATFPVIRRIDREAAVYGGHKKRNRITEK